MSLTKDKLANRLETQLGLKRKESRQLLEGLLNIIKATLTLGDGLLVSGFGKFTVRPTRQEPSNQGPSNFTTQKGIDFQDFWSTAPAA
jgi:nucleoid DNA-binding protein